MTKCYRYVSLILLAGFASIGGFVQAQQDTVKKRTIDITSTFKPVLGNAAKINFNASLPAPDSSRPKLTYNIPAQNIYPMLQPVGLKPLALKIDSGSAWANSNFIKAGYGNLQTPFVQAGFSLGTPKAKLSLLANHVSSNGKIDYQDYSKTGFSIHGYTPVASNVELHGKFGVSQDKHYLYGYDHNLYNYSKSQLLQRFQTFSAEAGLRNLAPTEFGLRYHPDLKIDVFNDNNQNNESNAVLDVPVEKSIGDAFGIRIGFNADFTRFSPDSKSAITNNIYSVPLALLFKTPNFRFQGGLTPSWDNSTFKLLPNLMAEFPLSEDKWIVQAGWISYYNKGSYMRFASINPYLAVPGELRNTRVVERYVGFKGTILDHFTYNAKIGYVQFHQMPLFVNDTLDGKTFNIIFEEQLDAMQLHGEFGIIEAEDFTLHAAVNWFKFNDQKTESRAWGLVPSEIKASLRWKVINDLWLTSDFFLWDGPLYKTKSGGSERLGGAADLNAGLEFRVTKQLHAWAQLNNIFNAKYQRWHQYDSYGFNMLAGIIFSFNK
jgi:hypothetical protein